MIDYFQDKFTCEPYVTWLELAIWDSGVPKLRSIVNFFYVFIPTVATHQLTRLVSFFLDQLSMNVNHQRLPVFIIVFFSFHFILKNTVFEFKFTSHGRARPKVKKLYSWSKPVLVIFRSYSSQFSSFYDSKKRIFCCFCFSSLRLIQKISYKSGRAKTFNIKSTWTSEQSSAPKR